MYLWPRIFGAMILRVISLFYACKINLSVVTFKLIIFKLVTPKIYGLCLDWLFCVRCMLTKLLHGGSHTTPSFMYYAACDHNQLIRRYILAAYGRSTLIYWMSKMYSSPYFTNIPMPSRELQLKFSLRNEKGRNVMCHLLLITCACTICISLALN